MDLGPPAKRQKIDSTQTRLPPSWVRRTSAKIEGKHDEPPKETKTGTDPGKWLNHVENQLVSLGIVTDLRRLVLGYLVNSGNNIGIIVHWGLYSVPAFDSVESAEKRKIQNGSEWYAKRLDANASDFRPTSGWKETQAFHARTYPPGTRYSDFKEQFTAVRWDVDNWMQTFQQSGASYVILTAKHHDGFCLWPTATTPFCVRAATIQPTTNTCDLVGRFRDSARRHGLRFGVYYSWSEFDRNATVEYMDRVVIPQITELIRYTPDLFWFDGDWACRTNAAQKVMDQCVDRIRRALPDVEINDRIGHSEERKNDPNFLGRSTCRVYADRAIPETAPTVPWEHINTIGLSWGRNRQQHDHHYKSASELLRLYHQVTNLGGRFLLNVGPNSDGTLCGQETDRLGEFGRLIAIP